MARMARFKVSQQEAWYHLYSRICGSKDDYPLMEPSSRKRLIDLIHHYSSVYFCEVSTFCIMGNHYHLVLKFDKPFEVEADELKRRASILYPQSAATLNDWPEEKWHRLRERLFDVSEFMRNVQSAFSRWYNPRHHRRGGLWSGRFKSTYLHTPQSVIDSMLYVELNAVRGGLTERPEDWKGGSLYLREINKADWLMPLRKILHRRSHNDALVEYRERLYYRGSVPTREGQAAISEEVLAQEKARGFEVSGVYSKRIGYFVDGIAIGTEGFIRELLAWMREKGLYLRRKNPVPQLDGIAFTVREQRSNAVVFD